MDLHTHRQWQGEWHDIAGRDYYFFNGQDTLGPARAHLPGFWTGSEGLAHPLKDRCGKRYVLKSFTIDCPERTQRMQWLCRHKLCDCHPLLLGAPYEYVGPPIDAQICPFVAGRTWDSIKNDELSLDSDERLWLAFCLAAAARLLEDGLDLHHSDLSPGNMLIDGIGGQERPLISLIDFDAFFHQDVPILPVGKGQTLGTPGYQAPECVKEGAIIRSDRFALAVHIHEFLAIGDDEDLGEPDHLFFEQDDLNAGRAEPTPRFKKYWGAEVDAIARRALQARSAKDRPVPQEWCDAFRSLGTGPAPEVGLLMTAERKGVRKRFDIRSTSVNLAQALSDPQVLVRLSRNAVAYQAAVTGPQCVAILNDGRTGKQTRLTAAPEPVSPGSSMVVAGWELTFHAKD